MARTHIYRCGIVFTREAVKTYLPLERVIADIDIVDVSAVVRVTQDFWQYSDEPVPSASYVFPVPAHAAVCGFEMRSQDGKVIKAVAKDREQARKEHEAAIQEGQMTGLVQHATDDVFLISLGVLPAKQQLTTVITYVMDLMEADISDYVRFQLPMAVGMRYGQVPQGAEGAPTANPRRVDINVNIRMAGIIRSIISLPSHPIIISTDETSTTVKSVAFSSDNFLQQDFVLVVRADGLDSPRCFAETHPTGTTALQLTMVPKFNFPPIPAQEYIFLVDRSGSMDGDRIETARATLTMLLRSLPSRGTTFNIFDFGSDCHGLWNESVQYSEESLAQATNYVDNISVNGGTEIRKALLQVFASRNKHISTACFVLTDGEAYDIDATLETVSAAVTSSSMDAPLRMFTLGIGNTTSTAMCEGIARLGNGVCLMAVESESIVAKTSKLLRASRSYTLKNVGVEWGLNFPVSSDVTVQTSLFRQAPDPVESIYAGNRFVVFALIKHSDFVLPDRVIVRAQQNGQGEVFTFEIPVERLPETGNAKQAHLIHTLTARRIIQELEDKNKVRGEEDNKRAIIHLGEQYQLASRYTSFIAVEKRKTTKPNEDARPGTSSAEDEDEDEGFVILQDQDWSLREALVETLDSEVIFTRRTNVGARLPALSMSMRTRASARLTTGGKAPRKQLATQSAQNTAPVEFSSIPAKRNVSDEIRPTAAVSVHSLDSPPMAVAPSSYSSPAPVNLPGIDGQVVSLVRLQSFDGSFTVSPALEAILGKETLAEGSKNGVDPIIWATVLAVAYMQKHLASQPELLEGLVEKAQEFVISSELSGTNFDEVLEMAKHFFK